MKKLPRHVLVDGEELALSAAPKGGGVYEVRIGTERLELRALDLGDEGFVFTGEDGTTHRARAAAIGEDVQVRVDGRTWRLESAERVHGSAAEELDPNEVHAPMTGTVVQVLVAAGDEVAAEQELVVLSAMKMEHKLRAPREGVVERVGVAVGDTVEAGGLLVRLEEG